MPLVMLTASAFAALTISARGEIADVAAGAPFALGSGGESEIAVARYSDTAGIACYLGGDVPPGYAGGQQYGRRGGCTLLEPGAAGPSLITLSDKTRRNVMASFSSTTAVWCYADEENNAELKCRKMNLAAAGEPPEQEQELTVKDHLVHYDSRQISVATFSQNFLVVCYETPATGQIVGDNPGALACGLPFVWGPEAWVAEQVGTLDINGHHIVRKADTSKILSTSVASFSATSGVVCYTDATADGNEVACTLLTIAPNAGGSHATLSFGESLQIVSASDAGPAVVTALSSDTALACYSASSAGACVKLTFSGSELSKGSEVQISSGAISRVTLEAFSAGIALVCYQSNGASCNVLDVSGGELTVARSDGLGVTVDDATAETKLAIMPLTVSTGMLCYQSTSNSGACRDLQITSVTTTPHTTTATTATATSTTTSPHSTTDTSTVSESSSTATEVSSTESSSTTSLATTTVATSTLTTFSEPATTVAAETTPASGTHEAGHSTSPAQESSGTDVETESTGEDSQVSQVQTDGAALTARVGGASLGALAFAALWAAVM